MTAAATVLRGRATLQEAAGARIDARASLADAADLFERGGAPYEAARVRIELGRLLDDMGRADDAVRERARGEQTLHEFLERSVWHAAQHTRQLQLVVEKLGLTPDPPLTVAQLAGLPLPDNVWDDKLKFA